MFWYRDALTAIRRRRVSNYKSRMFMIFEQEYI
jgi:hypothetical protein